MSDSVCSCPDSSVVRVGSQMSGPAAGSTRRMFTTPGTYEDREIDVKSKLKSFSSAFLGIRVLKTSFFLIENKTKHYRRKIALTLKGSPAVTTRRSVGCSAISFACAAVQHCRATVKSGEFQYPRRSCYTKSTRYFLLFLGDSTSVKAPPNGPAGLIPREPIFALWHFESPIDLTPGL